MIWITFPSGSIRVPNSPSSRASTSTSHETPSASRWAAVARASSTWKLRITRPGSGLTAATSSRPSISTATPPKRMKPSSSGSQSKAARYQSRSRRGSLLPSKMLPRVGVRMASSVSARRRPPRSRPSVGRRLRCRADVARHQVVVRLRPRSTPGGMAFEWMFGWAAPVEWSAFALALRRPAGLPPMPGLSAAVVLRLLVDDVVRRCVAAARSRVAGRGCANARAAGGVAGRGLSQSAVGATPRPPRRR